MKKYMINKTKWITLFMSLCILGYSVMISNESLGSPADGCYFKKTYGIACAACGGSHAIQSLFRGDLLMALRYNALAVILVILSILASVLVLVDYFYMSAYFMTLITKIGQLMKLKTWSYLIAFLLIIFWIFNSWKYG